MKSYINCPLKRSIQKVLWNNIKSTNILGLSSPDLIVEYIRALPKRKALYLVNFNPNSMLINANSLIGLFDILLNKNIYIDFIDADFCDSIKSSGDDLIYIYNKCKKLNKNIVISFTFSIRGVGLTDTIKWLKNNFPELRLRTSKVPFYKSIWKPRQFAYAYGDCIHYRESGDQMFSGIIKVKKK